MTKRKPTKRQELKQITGMERQHLIALAETAVANDTAIIFRPVNDSVRDKFAAGAVGKGMDVKGKSADQGHEVGLDGLIPVNQYLSKLGSQSDLASAAIYQQKNDAKLKEDTRRYKDIMRTKIGELSPPDRIQFEESLKNLVKATTLKDKDGNNVVFFEDAEGYPIKDEDGKFIFAIKKGETLYIPNTEDAFTPPDGAEEKPVKVLSYRQLSIQNNKLVVHRSKPITADYDQLAVFTRLENKGNAHAIEDKPHAGFATGTGHVVTTALARDTEDNLAISHGQETGNPIPEKIVDSIYTVFEPTDSITRQCERISAELKMVSSEEDKAILNKTLNTELLKAVKVIRTEQELIDFYNRKEREGYQAPVNEAWGWRRNEAQQYEIDPNRVLAQDLYIEEHKLLDDEELVAQHPHMQGMITEMSETYRGLRRAKLEPLTPLNRKTSQILEQELQSQIQIFRNKTGLMAPIEAAWGKTDMQLNPQITEIQSVFQRNSQIAQPQPTSSQQIPGKLSKKTSEINIAPPPPPEQESPNTGSRRILLPPLPDSPSTSRRSSSSAKLKRSSSLLSVRLSSLPSPAPSTRAPKGKKPKERTR